jgi:two-component system LytT family response regulator/two-component system response regulator LytT
VPATLSAALSALVVDDEALAADEVVFLLKQVPQIEVLGTASNGLDAVKLIETLEPDVVFLDVQMPGLDGLGVIRELRQHGGPLPHFVLTTAFDHYAVEAFRLEALDYLLKPISEKQFAETIARVQRAAAERPPEQPAVRPANVVSKVLVRQGPRNLIVDAQDLVYATVDDGVVRIVTTGLEGESAYRTIEELQSSLDPDLFWRAHRSYLVNINRIREVIPWFKSSFQLKMDDKRATEIPVSRVQTKRLRQLFKL